jgi:hypothetical protein
MWLTIHSNERMQYTFQPQSMVQSQRNQDRARSSTIPDQAQEISSLESMIIRRRDVTKGIQPKFVY